MATDLNRKRSATSGALSVTNPNIKATNRKPARVYSVSSDIVPQALTHPDEDVHLKTSKSPHDAAPRWSQVGFQSIFHDGSNARRSTDSIEEEYSQGTENNDGHSEIGSSSSNRMEGNTTSNDSLFSSNSRGNKRRLSIFTNSKDNMRNRSRSGSKNYGTVITGTSSSNISRSGSKLFHTKSNMSVNSLQSSLSTGHSHSNKGSNVFSKMAKKLLPYKPHNSIGKDDVEPVVPSPFSKFLHSSYGKHRSPVQFIHTSTGGLIDSGKSVYSFNPSINNNPNDTALSLIQDDAFDATNVSLLHDLLKNLPSLIANYKSFTVQELFVLEGNIWGIYCSIVVELFKNKRVWQLPAKIEDIDRLLEFYITLKTQTKAAVTHSRFLAEIEEFITTSLYILENQIVFNYANEDTVNTALKRVGIIWKVFYQQVYYDMMAVLLPFEKSFQKNSNYWLDGYLSEPSRYAPSIDVLLLKCFRDSIILPYYESFLHTNDGASKSFQRYIFSEEEQNGVTEEDKLTLLQCFGILNTIKGNSRNQRIIGELLEGIRMSI
ncbi:putative target of rapamycin complex 2 subunit bit2 [Saccharomyces cerevisiae]|nr:Bit2p [Saccharomyces cerevisiae YJM1402]AJP83409.1 Bit2p [Saccharomyces cerevisiae YJM1418]AJP83796.1 Bit2p [Saccharomyces cerevisiae YJM1419]AJP84171.1 Bit2p [Saccharomyces cerevisiae YJM1433]AJP84558.1 Bit2p [Saccharomyces cerevisiae YJM1434]AJP85700.1 Bit2p [Saccharomyces cerevisiae YJM1444]AJP86842.1 Bit2p [Saccharomyces cerevisiae YJM1460]AJP89883.1 Bit2p [Saccharomyces cerevisiae YJM1573]AJP90590.1 Bit2p [Saccharomyces cerevisiae YJM1592]AJP91357.1 Bit2p [Saccharomyces cerevisiae 